MCWKRSSPFLPEYPVNEIFASLFIRVLCAAGDILIWDHESAALFRCALVQVVGGDLAGTLPRTPSCSSWEVTTVQHRLEPRLAYTRRAIIGSDQRATKGDRKHMSCEHLWMSSVGSPSRQPVTRVTCHWSRDIPLTTVRFVLVFSQDFLRWFHLSTKR